MPKVEWWKGLLTMFYGGIFDEIVMRLFFMIFLFWILAKLFANGAISSAVYWTVILLSALLFGIGHLPLAQEFFGSFATAVILRTLLANGLLAVLFDY